MLRFRICSRCGSKNDPSSSFFCFQCGNLLDPIQSNSQKIETPLPLKKSDYLSGVESQFSLNDKIRVVVSVGIGIFFLLGSLSVISFYFGGLLRREFVPVNEVHKILLRNLSYNYPDFEWDIPMFSQYSPFNSDIFIFGKYPQEVLGNLLQDSDDGDYRLLMELLRGKDESPYQEEFVFLTQGSSSAYLVKPKSTDYAKDKIKVALEGKRLKNYQPYWLGETLVFSDQLSLFTQISQAFEKKRISLYQTTAFSESQRKLPHSGKLLVVTASKPFMERALTMLFGDRIGNEISGRVKTSSVVFSESEGGTLLNYLSDGK